MVSPFDLLKLSSRRPVFTDTLWKPPAAACAAARSRSVGPRKPGVTWCPAILRRSTSRPRGRVLRGNAMGELVNPCSTWVNPAFQFAEKAELLSSLLIHGGQASNIFLPLPPGSWSDLHAPMVEALWICLDLCGSVEIFHVELRQKQNIWVRVNTYRYHF